MNLDEFKSEHFAHYIEMGGSYEYSSSDNGQYPSTYLEYSREDLSEESSKRTRVNSVGNAKRALHLQVERICSAFGFDARSPRKTHFPARLEYLGDCGIISPSILTRLNRVRNKVEHDYYIPTKDEAEDYVDIVELFILATKNLLDKFPASIHFELMDDEEYDKALDLPKEIEVRIAMDKGGVEIVSSDNTRKIEITDKDYFMWLSQIVGQYQL